VEDVARPWRALAVVSLVLLASWLRFTGLSWGLRHPVHVDEGYFVGSTVAMVRAGDLNHREYRYPGLFFYLLAPGIALLGPERMEGPDAYLVSRALVAGFGVLNVVLLYWIGSKLVGPWGGFSGALLLAVLPLDIMTSHQVRPEIPLTTAAILAIAAFRRVSTSLRGDVLSGLAIGFGTAIKYSAPFLFPSYLLTRWLTPGRRLLGALTATGLILAVPLLCTPYAVLHPRLYGAGTRTLTDAYYVGYNGGTRSLADVYHLGETTFFNNLIYYLRDGESALGWFATILALLGVALSLRRSWRAWAPILVHPVTTVVVMSTATLVFPRQILQAMPLLCLMAGVPVEVAASRNRLAGLVLLLAAVVIPLRASVAYAEAMRRPSSEDLAVDWIEAHVKAGSRILETRPEASVGEKPGAALGLDPRRYDLVYYLAHPNPQRKKDLALLAPHMDLIITGPEGGGSWAADLQVVYRAPDDLAFKVPTRRLACTPVDLSGAQWSASESSEALADGLDPAGRPWSTSRPMRGGEWIEIELKDAAPVGRVEVVLGNSPWRRPPQLTIATASARGGYEDVDAVETRPSLKALMALGRPESRLLVLAPRPVHGVRIQQTGEGDLPWMVSTVRLEACREAPDEGRLLP
jgi:hypothetical protein